jgi:hypothetical protein
MSWSLAATGASSMKIAGTGIGKFFSGAVPGWNSF